jgi:hypothetical protein
LVGFGVADKLKSGVKLACGERFSEKQELKWSDIGGGIFRAIPRKSLDSAWASNGHLNILRRTALY